HHRRARPRRRAWGRRDDPPHVARPRPPRELGRVAGRRPDRPACRDRVAAAVPVVRRHGHPARRAPERPRAARRPLIPSTRPAIARHHEESVMVTHLEWSDAIGKRVRSGDWADQAISTAVKIEDELRAGGNDLGLAGGRRENAAQLVDYYMEEAKVVYVVYRVWT